MPLKRSPLRRAPIHPGLLLRDDVIPALKMTISKAAEELGVTRQTLHRVMAGETSISPEMALRLGKFCGNGPDLWLQMQERYDLWHARQKLGDEIKRIPTHAA